MILLDGVGLRAARPGRVLFDDLDITVSDGDRIAVVGINGTGKSTLLGVLAGTAEPERGEVRRGRGVEVGVLDQDPRLHGGTLFESLHQGLGVGAWEVDAVADRLGLGGDVHMPVEALSGGQRKRAALVRALVADARLLVLDEPTNHLDIDAIDWLEERLAAHRGALVMVTHDRHFLDRVCTRIVELDRGVAHVHDGGYTSYLEHRAGRARTAEAAEARRANLARRELAWLRRGAPARTSKPKARVASATRIVAPTRTSDVRADDLPLHTAAPRLGDRVIELHGVGHTFSIPGAGASGTGASEAGVSASSVAVPVAGSGAGPMLFADVELLLDPRERLGVIGPNGSGKSTLLEVMAGRLEPTEGTVEHGATVRVGVFDQHGRDLADSARAREVVAGPGVEPDWTHGRLMEAFWFDHDAQWAQVGTLSGGERRRLQLLVTLAEQPNVLLLDEPTNDLDTETLRRLEDYLEGFPGAVVVVSHDRAFLERVVTDVVVLGDGSATRRAGGYAAYEKERRSSRAAGKAHSGHKTSRGSAKQSGTVQSGNVQSGTVRSGTVQSGTGPLRSAPGSTASGPDGDPGAGTGQRGPSPSTLRHRLRGAERALEALRARCDDLYAALQASDDHEELARLGAELAEAESELSAAEDTWLALADEIEGRGLALGGGGAD